MVFDIELVSTLGSITAGSGLAFKFSNGLTPAPTNTARSFFERPTDTLRVIYEGVEYSLVPLVARKRARTSSPGMGGDSTAPAHVPTSPVSAALPPQRPPVLPAEGTEDGFPWAPFLRGALERDASFTYQPPPSDDDAAMRALLGITKQESEAIQKRKPGGRQAYIVVEERESGTGVETHCYLVKTTPDIVAAKLEYKKNLLLAQSPVASVFVPPVTYFEAPYTSESESTEKRAFLVLPWILSASLESFTKRKPDDRDWGLTDADWLKGLHNLNYALAYLSPNGLCNMKLEYNDLNATQVLVTCEKKMLFVDLGLAVLHVTNDSGEIRTYPAPALVAAAALLALGAPVPRASATGTSDSPGSGRRRAEVGGTPPAAAEWHDWAPHYYAYTAFSHVAHCAGDADWSETAWVQLSTPPAVPWKYTKLWFLVKRVDAKNKSSEASAVAGVYSVRENSVGHLLYVGDRTSSSPFAFTALPVGSNRSVDVWQSIDVSADNLIAWSRGVFVGIEVSGCGDLGFGASENRGHAGRLSFFKPEEAWIRTDTESTLGAVRALALRLEGVPYAPPRGTAPPLWHCDAAAYNDSVCDCQCGDWDVDCAGDPRSPRCPDASYVCNPLGACVQTGWNASGCPLTGYWGYDGCHCTCGIPDPDCYDPFTTDIVNCPGLSIPQCRLGVGIEPTACADGWNCSVEAFGDGSLCNCECGGVDPDCSNKSRRTTCADNFRCTAGHCTVPKSWKCPEVNYNAQDGCDCQCGAYDPDCDATPSSVYGCDQREVCGYDSTCLTPKCGNNHTEPDSTYTSPEQCDGGLGCSDSCTCLPGYRPKNPLRGACDPVCSDGVAVPGEECDGGLHCDNCKCTGNHSAYYPSRTSCVGCGNGILDDNESCDRGSGCGSDCVCLRGYTAAVPPALGCIADTNRKALEIGLGVAGGALALILVITVAACVAVRRVKNAPRRINVPIELFTSTRCVAVPTNGSSSSSQTEFAVLEAADIVTITPVKIDSRALPYIGADMVLYSVGPPPSSSQTSQMPDPMPLSLTSQPEASKSDPVVDPVADPVVP
eukprot:m51a1_g1757 putative serine-threonine protein (1055) ;mRNA; f:247260-252356